MLPYWDLLRYPTASYCMFHSMRYPTAFLKESDLNETTLLIFRHGKRICDGTHEGTVR